jgi:hypothetical protein
MYQVILVAPELQPSPVETTVVGGGVVAEAAAVVAAGVVTAAVVAVAAVVAAAAVVAVAAVVAAAAAVVAVAAVVAAAALVVAAAVVAAGAVVGVLSPQAASTTDSSITRVAIIERRRQPVGLEKCIVFLLEKILGTSKSRKSSRHYYQFSKAWCSIFCTEKDLVTVGRFLYC